MNTSDVDPVSKEKIKTEYVQTAEEVQMDMLAAGHAVTTNDLKDASYSPIKIAHRQIFLRGTLHNLFMENIELRIQAPKFLVDIMRRVPKSKTFTNPLATAVKLQMGSTLNKLCSNTKKIIYLTEEKQHLLETLKFPTCQSSLEKVSGDECDVTVSGINLIARYFCEQTPSRPGRQQT